MRSPPSSRPPPVSSDGRVSSGRASLGRASSGGVSSGGISSDRFPSGGISSASPSDTSRRWASSGSSKRSSPACASSSSITSVALSLPARSPPGAVVSGSALKYSSVVEGASRGGLLGAPRRRRVAPLDTAEETSSTNGSPPAGELTQCHVSEASTRYPRIRSEPLSTRREALPRKGRLSMGPRRRWTARSGSSQRQASSLAPAAATSLAVGAPEAAEAAAAEAAAAGEEAAGAAAGCGASVVDLGLAALALAGFFSLAALFEAPCVPASAAARLEDLGMRPVQLAWFL